MSATYEQTLQKLQVIMNSLERDTVSVDELEKLLGTGFDLLSDLHTKLTTTETKIEEIINSRTRQSIDNSQNNSEAT